MTYTQKYSIVCMLQPYKVGDEFTYETWPLHVTMADVFAIDWHGGKVIAHIKHALADVKAPQIVVGDPAQLGTAHVMLLQNTTVLQSLHEDVISVLDKNGAVFNNPEFTGEGFVAHCTIQKDKALKTGDTVSINNLCVIDMFVDADPAKRKIVNVLPLQ